MFLFILTYIILLLTSYYPRKLWDQKFSSVYYILTQKKENFSYSNKTAEQFKIIEYPLIILFIISGGTLLMCSNDLITIFLAIELQSYGLYLLCSIYRNSELATNAGLTYFLLGGLSSCIILLGQSLLYINSGNTSLDAIYIINSIFVNNIEIGNNLNSGLNPNFLHLSMLILSTGFLFKVSAAPFHFWSPDVYDAIPTIVTSFVAIIAKITILIFLLELVYYTSSTVFVWKNNLLISSFLSLIIGSVLGLTQKRIKRLLAYSTISHLGFILLALSINSAESIQAFYFYIIQYSITNLNAFLILISIGYSFITLTNKKEIKEDVSIKENVVKENVTMEENALDPHSPIQYISQFKGFFHINSVLTLSLAVTLYSFIGVPPLAGFFAKQMILSSALDNGYVFMALVAILTSVIGAVYYLAIIKELFFEKNDYSNISIQTGLKNTNSKSIVNNIYLTSSLTSSISILTLLILLFIFIPQEILSLTSLLSLVI
jgi:NADH-ubiquinone oxidoreductase chain 2